jgi:PAS domain S-box-containing protein
MNLKIDRRAAMKDRGRGARSAATLIIAAALTAITVCPAFAGTRDERLAPRHITAAILADGYPTQFCDQKTNNPSGFAVDVMDAVAQRAGLNVAYICERNFNDLVDKLLDHEADVLPSFAIMPERGTQIDYTRPLDDIPLYLFVRADNDTVHGLGGGITVGVSRGGLSEAVLKKTQGITLKRYAGFSEALADLLAGRIDGFASSEATALGLARKAGVENRIKAVGPPHGIVKRAFAVRKGETRLLALLNDALQGFVGTPEYQQIYMRWYGRPAPFWTNRRIVLSGVAAMLLIIAVMSAWRYLSVRRAEQEVRSFASIIQNLPEAVCSIDPSGITKSWNRGAEKMLGFRAGEIIGRPITTIIPAEIAQQELDHCLTLLNAEGSFSGYESVRLTKDGRKIPVKITGVAIRDEAKAISGYASIVEDITERKRAEEERLKSHKLESIGLLAGGIAHDFNNLLTIIMSNIDLAKGSMRPEEEAYNRLSHAEQICGLAGGLSMRLMTFATGGDPEKTIMPINGLLKDAAVSSLRGSNIEAAFDLPDDLRLVAIDEEQLRQVVGNLAKNAREAMPQGGTLTVRGRNFRVNAADSLPMREGDYLHISIGDSGVGIPAERLAKIFDPYFSTKDSYSKKGLGLDLAVCYSVIKSHDGLLNVESETGKGTTFHIYLPAAG